MPIYQTSNKESFLDLTLEFIFTNFRNNFDKVKIILPNPYLCNYLQKMIINKAGTTILPYIIPITNINSEKDETFKIPSTQIGKITSLEERIILAKIINSYDKLDYNFAQSLGLSSSLAKLFFEFEANNIDLATLKNIPTIDQAEHWNFIYNFLEFAYLNWQTNITDIKKLTSANYQKLMFNAELGRVKNPDNYTIIAGVIGNNQITQKFIHDISNLKNGYVILPPVPLIDINKLKLEPEDALYNIQKLIQIGCDSTDYSERKLKILEHTLKCKKDQLQQSSLNSQHNYDMLDNLLFPTDSSKFSENIQFIEFDNIFLEAEYIAQKSITIIDQNPSAKIAILITNDKTKKYFCAKLNKYGIIFSDLIGADVLNLRITTLLIEISENICRDFSLRNFISLISHPLVISDESRQLKKLIVKENRFASNIDEIIKNDPYWVDLVFNLKKNNRSRNLALLIKKIIKISKILCKDLWQRIEAKKIYEVLSEATKINYNIIDAEILPEILKSLLSGGRVVNNIEKDSNITICSPNDVTLMNYDILIYTNFVQNSYPIESINNPWLNNQMVEKLGIDAFRARFGNTMYDFYLNLHNKNILITRSIKNAESSISVASPFIFRLKHILGENLKQIKVISEINSPVEVVPNNYATSQIFPEQISATDIETLIRAPYNFYAKKILNLKPEREIEEDPKLSEFGSLFHKVIELYTKNYETIPTKSIKNYAKELLDNSIYPKHIQKFWQFKIESIEKDFIIFDEKMRNSAKKIFSEISGEFEINVAGKKIKITAIADRIDITHDNKAVIFDYKTGALPSKKDVLSGMSPQLMIEAIILLEGGYLQIGNNIETENLIYVKINSSKPFISTSNISINKDDILEHKKGLLGLIEHYILTGQYQTEINLMKYDDYWHLARR